MSITSFQLKLTQQDGSPLLDTGKLVSVKITEDSQGFPNVRNNPRVADYSFGLPASGLLMIDHQTAPNATNLRIEVRKENVPQLGPGTNQCTILVYLLVRNWFCVFLVS